MNELYPIVFLMYIPMIRSRAPNASQAGHFTARGRPKGRAWSTNSLESSGGPY